MSRITKIYREFLLLALMVSALLMSYIALKENDSCFWETSSDAGYLPEYQIDDEYIILAEGMEQVTLYPQTYELTVDAKTESDAVSFQVLDRWSHTLLAEHVYTPGEEYHTVRFTTDQIYQDVVVRSIYRGPLSEYDHSVNKAETVDATDLDGVIRIYGYTMRSDGAVGCDAKWEIILLAAFLSMLFLGIHRATHKGKNSCLFLLALSAGASLPFLSNYLPEGHDISFHMARICSIGLAIQNHQIPQRLNYTLGGNEIIPIMYPEILLTGAGYMVASGATVFLAYKVVCIFITFLTAFLAYYAVRSEMSEKTALLFASVYLLNPYRMNELFVRAAIGEALGMAFLPLVVVGMWKFLHEREKHGIKLLFIGYTGLICSHIVLTVISAFFCAIFLVAEFLIHPLELVRKWKRLGKIIFLGGMLLAVNCWFLLPFLYFYRWNFAISSGEHPEWIQSTAPYIWQIFMGESGYGYNNMSQSANGEMPLTIGPAMLLGMVVFLFMCTKGHFQGKQVFLTSKGFSCGKWCLFLGMIAIYLSSPYFPWTYMNENVSVWAKTMGNIQYSWRMLTFASLLLSLLLVIVARGLFQNNSALNRMLAGGMILLVVLSGLDAATGYYENPDYMYNRFDNELATSFDYITAEAAKNYSEIKTWIESGEGPENTEEESSLQIVDYRRDGVNYWFSYEKEEGETVEVTMPVFWYGLHKAYLTDGTGSAAAGNSEEIAASMNEDNQFTVVTLPAGSTGGEVVLQYEEPLLFRIGNWISIVSVAGLVLAAVGRKVAFPRKRKVRKIHIER